MNVIDTEIDGVYIIEPRIFKDSRGYFYESFSDKEFRDKVGNINFIQDNQSMSSYGVLRGLHFQKGNKSQAKLVRCITGKVLDIAVDIREGSATFGKYVSCMLTEDNFRQFFVPRGFAHGFVVLSETALFQYKCDNYYAPESEGGIAWDDPDIHIDWQIVTEDIVLSEKDKHHPSLKEGYRFI
ncbi:MAG: dTDP-4-dehydrorhamnose 3,5-epimerase [Bacteroidaceae bacterium]